MSLPIFCLFVLVLFFGGEGGGGGDKKKKVVFHIFKRIKPRKRQKEKDVFHIFESHTSVKYHSDSLSGLAQSSTSA